MSTDEPQNDVAPDAAEQPKSPVNSAPADRKRPRLDLSSLGGRDRKRGKSMLGLLVGTLNKAKIEDKERSASDAAKKRQLIEQRLQAKLRKETDSVRRAEQAKREKTIANRKEEDLQLKDSIYKLRRTRLPLLANFLLTSDVIPPEDPSAPSDPLASAPRSHPPPLYYLPAVLTPEQQTFLDKRKAEVAEAVEKEWDLFRAERAAGIEEINTLRQQVADEEARQKIEKATEKSEMDTEAVVTTQETPASPLPPSTDAAEKKDAEMEIDESALPPKVEASKSNESERKDESATMQADDDDAVEY